MAINIINSKTYSRNNSTIHISNSTIDSNNSEIYGDNNTINGNNNDIKGNNNKIIGNNNDIKGDYNQIIGNNNDAKGHNCSLTGNNNDYKVKKPKNKISKTLDSMIDDSIENAFVILGNRGGKYTGKTPHEALAKFKAGEKARFEIEQANAKVIRKAEEEKILNEYKIQQRLWKIDNVNLTDEEYKIIEEYMDEIKPLWEIW
jgi:hypothetical protein